jgi:hypothetical protein
LSDTSFLIQKSAMMDDQLPEFEIQKRSGTLLNEKTISPSNTQLYECFLL